jgi:hypothetical protein
VMCGTRDVSAASDGEDQPARSVEPSEEAEWEFASRRSASCSDDILMEE